MSNWFNLSSTGIPSQRLEKSLLTLDSLSSRMEVHGRPGTSCGGTLTIPIDTFPTKLTAKASVCLQREADENSLNNLAPLPNAFHRSSRPWRARCQCPAANNGLLYLGHELRSL